MTVDAVVFDVGGVLCSTSPVEEFAKVDAEYGLPPGTVQGFLRGGPLFAQVETGRMPVAEFYQRAAATILAEHGIRVAEERLDAMLTACMGTNLRPEMLDLVAEVKAAGHRTGLLTNIFAERRPWLHGLFADGVLDVVCDSSEVGLRKPDRAIYEHLLAMLAARADEVVFVDDFAENVAAARSMGMGTVLFESPEQARRELVGLGVRIRAEERATA